jgi:hypothetical protein
VPKFKPCLRHLGQRGQNASGRWVGFFPPLFRKGPNQTSAVRLRWAVEDALTTSASFLVVLSSTNCLTPKWNIGCVLQYFVKVMILRAHTIWRAEADPGSKLPGVHFLNHTNLSFKTRCHTLYCSWKVPRKWSWTRCPRTPTSLTWVRPCLMLKT